MAVYLGENLVDAYGGTKNIDGEISLQSKEVDPNESVQYVTADSNYDGLNSVQVNAISNTYIGSNIKKKKATTYIPNDTEQIILAGQYLSEDQTIKSVPIEEKTITSNGVHHSSMGMYFNKVTVDVPSDSPILGEKQITSNGTYLASNDNLDGYDKVIVNVPSSSADPVLQSKTVNPKESIQTINPDAGYDGLSSVTVNAIQTETKDISANGTYASSSGKYFKSVTVNVANSPILQTKTINPDETIQSISPDNGYDGLSKVTVNAIPSTYVGSGVQKRTSSDLITSGETVTIPAGYYDADTSKSVYTAILATPIINVDSNGLITATENQTTSGYISASTKTETKQLLTKGATDYIPNGTVQTIPSGIYLTGDQTIHAVPTETKSISPTTSKQSVSPSTGKYLSSVTVEAIPTTVLATPSISVNSNGLITASSTQDEGYVSAGTKTATKQLDTLNTNTYIPNTSDQTISSGQYLTGVQTIKGDTNLVGSNIIAGKSIFGVTGTVVIQKYYVGTTEPSSSLGNDDDLYLVKAV